MNGENHMTGVSLDISAENRAKLKELFPSVFSEVRNSDGETIEAIDFERLKAEVGTFSDIFESRRERYGMDWPGKKDSLRLIQTPSYATLKPARDESVNFDSTENLFIEGDNLEVLKLLQKSYYGKIKMIYIDPPYNTGKEFIYPDNYTESLETYLEYAGLADAEGKKFSSNSSTEGRFHTKWLNMMYPRLYLARNLLRDDGTIFISIDDNEVNNLRKICDEVFGEQNFIASIIWEKKFAPQNDDKYLTEAHDYILLYGKQIAEWKPNLFKRTEDQIKGFKNPDNDPRGVWTSGDLTSKTKAKGHSYCIVSPSGKENYPPTGRQWAPALETYKTWLDEGRIWFGEDNNNFPRHKQYLSEIQDGIVPMTIWHNEDVGHNQEAKQEFNAIMDRIDFETPKPTRLVTRMLELATTDPTNLQYNEPEIILDFFSGSSTTAHAALDINKDGGKRKFILVQLPEPCDERSSAFKAGYKTIADIGKERIRRVIKNMNEEDAGKLDLDARQDRGFKVFKLNKSNFKQWQQLEPSTPEREIEKQLELHVDHIDHDATSEDLLYEILIKAGYKPTEKIELVTIAGQKVFSVSNGDLFLYLEESITKDLISAVLDKEPALFICLDSAFHGNDQLKANTVETFKARNMQKDVKKQIIFKTV